MSDLPIGEHLVCIVDAEMKASRSGEGGFVALTIESLSGDFDRHTHIDRLNLKNAKPHVERIAGERLAAYAGAVGIASHEMTNPADLLFKPFIVTLGPQSKAPGRVDVKKLSPVSDAWKPDAREIAWQRQAEARKRKAAQPDPVAHLMPSPAPVAAPADALMIRRVSDVPIERIDWLWDQRFAIGKVAIVTGDPGLGKSQFTMFLAAQVTTGGEWPNGEGRAPEGDVLILCCEDEIGDTIRPRLEAVNGDVSRVYSIDAVATVSGKRRTFDLQSDLEALDALIASAPGNLKLVIIDPISAYMGGGKDTHKASDVRAVLNPVQELAARHDVAIVCVAHPPKSVAGGKAVNAVNGSGAYIAASRFSWLFSKEYQQDGETGERIETGRVLMTEAKNNLGKSKGLALRICTRSIQTDIGFITAPYVAFENGYVDTTADQALSDTPQTGKRLNRSAAERAKTFLQFELANGDVEASVLMQRAEQHSLTERVLQKAADEIGIIKRREGFGAGGRSVWGYAKPSDTLFSADG
ncbi:AAA family ATPase [Hyphomonas sp.]|uniref:AAA family ATPase n=1 Tax=Hyphomonas sp. TaxID=87 RepID=UPI00391A6CD8